MRLKDDIMIDNRIGAVVSLIYSENKVEAVYYQMSTNKYIAETCILVDGVWQFEDSGPNGINAENSDRLMEYVKLLQQS